MISTDVRQVGSATLKFVIDVAPYADRSELLRRRPEIPGEAS